jgi:hypothetical protein
MQRRAESHGDDEGQGQPNPPRLQRREAADRDQGRKMVEPDDGMTESRQKTLQEGRRHSGVHRMMGESRLGRQQDQWQPYV